MAIEWAVPAFPYVEYDGTNAAEIADGMRDTREANYGGGWISTVVSQAAGVAVIEVGADGYATDVYTLETGVRYGLTGQPPVAAADWDTQYIKVS